MSERLMIRMVQRPASVRDIPQFGAGITAADTMTQPRIGPSDSDRTIRRAIAALNSGAVDLERGGQSGGVGDNMAFTPLDPLTGVTSSDAVTFRGFYALAVDDAGRRPQARSRQVCR
jgi:hypothetical protein